MGTENGYRMYANAAYAVAYSAYAAMQLKILNYGLELLKKNGG